VIIMENEEYGSIIGNPSAPYINGLAASGALATRYYAIAHPSLPNYLALTGGSTFGITNDCSPGPGCSVSAPSLVDGLATAGLSWKGYMEDMPSPCAQSSAGNYAVKHNPFVYYTNVMARWCNNVVPAGQLQTDIAAAQLPAFAWLTPNLCNDMHDCPVPTGDAYLAGVVPPILNALGPNGVLFVVWDEGKTSQGGGLAAAAGGQVTLIAAGGPVRRGYRSPVAYSHYSLLRTIEDGWGLPALGGSAQDSPMNDLFAGP
jgi:acid phosphatase